jgi:hypothetical protein
LNGSTLHPVARGVPSPFLSVCANEEIRSPRSPLAVRELVRGDSAAVLDREEEEKGKKTSVPLDRLPSMPSTKNNDSSKSHLPLVVVAGATGHIGSQVVKELVKSGKFRVRAIVRPRKEAKSSANAAATSSSSSAPTSSSSAVAARLSKLGAEIWHGDVTEPATIAGCCDGATAAVSALGVRSFDRKDGSVW